MTTLTRKFPIGVQDFEKLRTSGYLYIDKTGYVHQLLALGEAVFLNRPRRFGKSLLVSTLAAYFEGKKELFKGLALEKLETEWVKRPVLHIDFSGSKYSNIEEFKLSVNLMLSQYEQQYGKGENEQTFGDRFAGIIQRAAEQSGQEVAVLIDEYDAPLLDVLQNKEVRDQIQTALRNLFSPLKKQGKYIRFLFITGITKFSQLSIFSELNHLYNISMMPQFAAICGITEEELFSTLKQDVQSLAEANQLTYEEAAMQLKKKYDGYHFCKNSPDIYNPFSLIQVFTSQDFSNYWFSSGTPTFLLNLLQNQSINIDELEGAQLEQEQFNASIADNLTVIPTFYQSGYLTIKSYNDTFKTYTLGIPNEEVRVGLVKSLMPRILPNVRDDQNLAARHFILDLRAGDVDTFLTRLQAFFSNIPYELNNKNEKHYQTIFFVFVSLLGEFVQAERATAIGRTDMLVRTGGYLYLFEFKFNGSAEEALAQIDSKDYGLPYQVGNDKLVKVGVNFDATTRTIDKWIVNR